MGIPRIIEFTPLAIIGITKHYFLIIWANLHSILKTLFAIIIVYSIDFNKAVHKSHKNKQIYPSLIFLFLPQLRFVSFGDGLLFPPFFEYKIIKFISSFCDFAIERGKTIHLIFGVQLEFGNCFILYHLLLIFFVEDNVGLFLLKVG